MRFLPLLILLCGCASLRTPQPDPIPHLNPKGDVYKTEAENDWLIYQDAIGQKSLIMLYLEFPEKPMSMTSEERAEKVLGGGKFQALFHQQSYGKLTIEIEHIHGWRQLPEPRTAYGTKTTEAHRDLFSAIFALYPKVDLRKYDYIVANLSGLGNVAFGERDDLAIPYRNGTIRTALNIASNSHLVLAHEVGHLMGLPDIYTYGKLKPRNPAGPWDIMGSSRSGAFLGWHRHKLDWLDPDRKAYFTSGKHRLRLSPLSAQSGLSMVVVPVDNPANPSQVFVAEVAHREPNGVLIYSVDATLETGANPIVVYPRDTLKDAPFGPGQSFAEFAAPLQLTVVRALPDGGFEIDLQVRRAHLP